jgi:hypothetical protein
MGKKENKIKEILKEQALIIITGKLICRYHCHAIPAIKGNSSLMNGAVFQTGMLWVRGICQNKKKKEKPDEELLRLLKFLKLQKSYP